MIEAIHLTKRLGKNLALNDVNFRAEEGKVYGITGVAESGRSTLLKVLAGIFKPDIGLAMINGENIYENENIMRQLFFMPEDMYFPGRKDFKGVEDFYHGYYLFWDHERYLEMTGRLQLDQKKTVADLPAQEQRMAAWCCALASGARYVFLDAAFRNVGIEKRIILGKELKRYAQEKNACIVLSTDEEDREYFEADWLGHMEEGILNETTFFRSEKQSRNESGNFLKEDWGQTGTSGKGSGNLNQREEWDQEQTGNSGKESGKQNQREESDLKSDKDSEKNSESLNLQEKPKEGR